MSGFIKKTLPHIDAWQGTDYASGSAYTMVPNMPGLHKILKTCCIIDTWPDSKYSSGSEHATILICQVYTSLWTKPSIIDIW